MWIIRFVHLGVHRFDKQITQKRHCKKCTRMKQHLKMQKPLHKRMMRFHQPAPQEAPINMVESYTNGVGSIKDTAGSAGASSIKRAIVTVCKWCGWDKQGILFIQKQLWRGANVTCSTKTRKHAITLWCMRSSSSPFVAWNASKKLASLTCGVHTFFVIDRGGGRTIMRDNDADLTGQVPDAYII